MPAPFTPPTLRALLPKMGDDLCTFMEKAAAFDSAVAENIAWFLSQDGTDLADGVKLALCTQGNTTTTTSTTSSTSTTTT